MAESIKFNTTRFGEISVPADAVITMPRGMVGFPTCTRFVLIPHKEGSNFLWLQSLDAPELAFALTSPVYFDPNYSPPIPPAYLELLKASDPSTLEILVVLSVPHGQPEKMTANLRAPVVINPHTRLAAQVILEDPSYPIRKPLPHSSRPRTQTHASAHLATSSPEK